MLRIFAFLVLLILSAPAQAAEKFTAGGACSSDTNALDWDTFWQCASSAWQRAALFIGTSADTCDSTKAGKMRYNSPNMEYCNGSAWTVLTNSTTTPAPNSPSGTGYFVMSKSLVHACMNQTISTITHSGTTATVTTSEPHMLSAGIRVTMAGIVVGGASSALYNGTFTVASAPTSTSFTYTMSSDPGADPDAAAAGAALSSLTFSSSTVTATTSTNHNLVTGQYIRVINAVPLIYTGLFIVASVPTSTTFTYVVTTTPTTNTAVGSYSTLIGNYCVSTAYFDHVCLNELTTNTDWMGYSTANANGKLTVPNIHAFHCCFPMPPYATFAFARAGNASVGGATFKGDVSGLGPNDSANWANSNYFGTAANYWTERYNNSSIQWRNGARSSGENCNSWSGPLARYAGVQGAPNNTDSTRWYGGVPGSNLSATCDRKANFLCWVGP